MDFNEYYESQKWRELRGIVLEEANGCRLCGSTARLVVHHRTYKRFKDEHYEDLTVLCESCHQLFHSHHSYALENWVREIGKEEIWPGIKP